MCQGNKGPTVNMHYTLNSISFEILHWENKFFPSNFKFENTYVQNLKLFHITDIKDTTVESAAII